MKMVWLTVAGCLLLGLTGCKGSASSSNKDKLLGTWEASKGDLPKGSTIEFTKDGKIKIIVNREDRTLTREATYEVDGDQIKVVRKEGDKEVKEIIKIKALTDTQLVTIDERGKEDEFKKK